MSAAEKERDLVVPDARGSIVIDGTGDCWYREDEFQLRCISYRDPEFGDLYAHADSFVEKWGISLVVFDGATPFTPTRVRPA